MSKKVCIMLFLPRLLSANEEYYLICHTNLPSPILDHLTIINVTLISRNMYSTRREFQPTLQKKGFSLEN